MIQVKQQKFHLLLHSANLVEQELRIQLEPLNIKPRQARILDALDRMGAVSQVTLAREFYITPASMSTMITRLVTAGLVTAETDLTERRSKVVNLTDQGREVVEQVREVWEKVDRFIEQRIGADKAALLAGVTQELRDKLGGRMPGGDDVV